MRSGIFEFLDMNLAADPRSTSRGAVCLRLPFGIVLISMSVDMLQDA